MTEWRRYLPLVPYNKEYNFYTAFRNACCLYWKNWRAFALPNLCMALLFFVWWKSAQGIMHHKMITQPAGRILFLLSPPILFLLQAAWVNFFLQFFNGKKGLWKNIGEIFCRKRLCRLLVVLAWMFFYFLFVAFFLFLGFLIGEAGDSPSFMCKIGMWIWGLMIPIQFFSILSIFEKPDAFSWVDFLRGLRDTLLQRWEMWGVWFLGFLSYRILLKLISWLLREIPKNVFAFRNDVFLVLIILLMSCILPLGFFFMLSLRKTKTVSNCNC